jgi:hypothetical protein
LPASRVDRVTGVTTSISKVPSSFSFTTAMAVAMRVTMSSTMASTPGTMKNLDLKSGL